MRLTDRITKLETAAHPPRGSLPQLVVMPHHATPEEVARVRADVKRREANGETILLVSCTDDGFGALVDVCGP